jgi:hypothetical protein
MENERRESNERKRRNHMRKQIISVAAVLFLSIIAAGQCRAQQTPIVVNVPFAFQAGDKMLPAGEYRIRRVLAADETIQLVRQSDGDASTMVTTLPVERRDAPSPRMIFLRYGNEYFLAQIWTGETQGRQLYKSHTEKELATTKGSEEVALLAPVPSDKL